MKKELELKSIPGLATNQSGSLIFGELEGIPVYIVKGTNYLNEGHSAFQVTFVVRVSFSCSEKYVPMIKTKFGVMSLSMKYKASTRDEGCISLMFREMAKVISIGFGNSGCKDNFVCLQCLLCG